MHHKPALKLRILAVAALLAGSAFSPAGFAQVAASGGRDSPADVVLAWNQVMLDANAIDSTYASPDQGGPTRTARAFAIVAAAMYDACNAIARTHRPYLVQPRVERGARKDAAVTAAAYRTLSALYPQQRARLDGEYANWLDEIPRGRDRTNGLRLGEQVAAAMLAARDGDGSERPMPYAEHPEPGYHQVDPINPGQGYHGAGWSAVTPFVMPDVADFTVPPPPALGSSEYTQAYQEVYTLGAETGSDRTPEQTVVGIFWAYDGTPGLGKPPRLYNQIVQLIARQRRNSVEQNARLFALVNLAMGDASIAAWKSKYDHEFWRPIVAIRRGEEDANDLTPGDPLWRPLGAPYTNGPVGAPNFTPPFPAYVSGHATFGAAALRVVANFYGTDRIAFDFMSDEFNGLNRNQDGTVRPVVARHYDTLTAAIVENARSRIYLGIHWQFDADYGIALGNEIADYVSANALRPVRR